MTCIPYQNAKEITDRFLELLADRGITPPSRSGVEHEMLALVDLLDMWRNPERMRGIANEAEAVRCAAGIHDLAAKVLAAEALPDFASFDDHLKMVTSAREFTSIAQNTDADARDQISNKMAELYVGALAIHCGTGLDLDDPDHSKGDNPDVIVDYQGKKWTLAVKTLASKRNGQTIFDNIRRAAEQIDASRAEVGMVVINAKNVIEHERFWDASPPFLGVDDATEALRGELRALAELAAVDRPQAEWDALFTGKVVPPIVFLGQTVAYLPLDGAFSAPTPIKSMVAYGCNRRLDPVGAQLVSCLNHWMQTILHGLPGPPPC